MDIDRGKLRTLARLSQSEIGASEENVKQKFLVPLLEGLGHERTDLDFERSSMGRRLDVFIQHLPSDCKVIIDTKRYGEDLNRHLGQIGNYLTQEGALIAVITNGVEIRIYSPLRGIAFERCLLHALRRENVAADEAVVILSKFLSRDSLRTREVHRHLNEREAELRNAFLELQKASDRFDKLREDLSSELGDLRRQREEIEIQIEQKHHELSQLEERKKTAGIDPTRHLGIDRSWSKSVTWLICFCGVFDALTDFTDVRA